MDSEAIDAALQDLQKSMQAPHFGNDNMRREDSSEAVSAITTSPVVNAAKVQQDVPNLVSIYSPSTQSSQGCETTHQHSVPLRESEDQGLQTEASLLLDLVKSPSWELVGSVLDECIASLLRTNEMDTTLHHMNVSSFSKPLRC